MASSATAVSTRTRSKSRIDRLSRLPCELRCLIFDLLHDPDDFFLLPPLSKTLLPCARRSLYRDVALSSRTAFTRFLQTVSGQPAIASAVRSFITTEIDDVTWSNSLESLIQMFGFDQFSRNREIRPDASFADSSFFLADYLPSLETLGYGTAILDAQNLLDLSKFNFLQDVEIHFDRVHADLSSSITPVLPQLVGLTSLHLVYEHRRPIQHGADAEIARVIEHCPALSELALEDFGYPQFGPILSLLSSRTTQSITILELLCLGFDGVERWPCDHLLPLFSNLEAVDIDGGSISVALPTYLRQLPRLSFLRLGGNTHLHGPPTRDIIGLISGPGRIDTLDILALDARQDEIPEVGKRVDIGDGMGSEAEIDDMERDGWTQYDATVVGEFEELLKAGEENDVYIFGAILDYMCGWDALKLEEANRLILRAYHTKSLEEYFRVKADQEIDQRLPELDVDNLNLAQCRLVKLDVLEEGWYQLSLE